MSEIIDRIAKYRKMRGISHDAMAANLNITQAAYSKLEKGETKLSVDRLYKISEILEQSLEDLMGLENKYSQNIHQNEHFTVVGHQTVENLHTENKKIYDQLQSLYQDQINHLTGEVAFLREQLSNWK